MRSFSPRFVQALGSLALLVCGLVSGCDNKRTSPPPKDVEKAATPVAEGETSPSDAAAKVAVGASDAGGSKAGIPCGESTCGPGQVCCNASCGICTPPDGACIQMVCEPKDAGTVMASARCTSDADCATYSSYCGEMPCACLAVGKGGAPKCKEPNAVKCLVDPCRGKTAACQSGACVVTLK